MTSITVRGTAHVAVAPDRATLNLGLTHVATTSSSALEVVAERSQRLADLIGELGFTDTDWTTQGVAVAEEWEWHNETNTKVGYRATTGVSVRIVDLERVAPLLSRAVDDASAEVRDLRWSVSKNNPARRALLGAAAVDATHRADAYAEALGLQRGAVEEVSDPPIASSSSLQPESNLFAMRSKSADSSITMNVNPGEIDLEASVHVRFATLAH
jgi:uncharacterized protein YggE